jgi:hypothetical protein
MLRLRRTRAGGGAPSRPLGWVPRVGSSQGSPSASWMFLRSLGCPYDPLRSIPVGDLAQGHAVLQMAADGADRPAKPGARVAATTGPVCRDRERRVVPQQVDHQDIRERLGVKASAQLAVPALRGVRRVFGGRVTCAFVVDRARSHAWRARAGPVARRRGAHRAQAGLERADMMAARSLSGSGVSQSAIPSRRDYADIPQCGPLLAPSRMGRPRRISRHYRMLTSRVE